MTNVWIAGVGIITAIGNNVKETLQSLVQCESGIGPAGYLKTRHSFPVGEVKHDNDSLCKMTGLPSGTTRTALLSMAAAREALADSGIDPMQYRSGFISANSVGGMDLSERYFESYLTAAGTADIELVRNHESGRATEIVAERLSIKDYVTTISTACSSSANSIFFAARMIKNGLLDIAIAGGTDALTAFTLNGFNSLMILDHQPCRPFDENRKGLNLGEGAGYVVLVSETIAATLKRHPYCRLGGYHNANDAFHQTASSPEGNGSYLAMLGALKRSSLNPSDIDYINLHGTGTQNNDISEGTAVKRIFDPHYPLMSSTKAFTGHTLGASGGVEAVLSVLAIEHSIVYPNLRFSTQMKELPFRPVTEFLKGRPVRNVLSNSFGFGGNCTSLIFSKN
jgi:3-oxoacyl-[acyl-carrier-protein] synthase-1